MRSAAELLLKSDEAFIKTPESVHFDYLTFRTCDLAAEQKFSGDTAGNELCLVILGGSCSIESSVGSWRGVGERAHVFGGLPTALYLPIETRFSVLAEAKSLGFTTFVNVLGADDTAENLKRAIAMGFDFIQTDHQSQLKELIGVAESR